MKPKLHRTEAKGGCQPSEGRKPLDKGWHLTGGQPDSLNTRSLESDSCPYAHIGSSPGPTPLRAELRVRKGRSCDGSSEGVVWMQCVIVESLHWSFSPPWVPLRAVSPLERDLGTATSHPGSVLRRSHPLQGLLTSCAPPQHLQLGTSMQGEPDGCVTVGVHGCPSVVSQVICI